MFGLMELTAQLDESTRLAIIPTVVLPFTILGMILTSVATYVAAFFGVELKAEGPKRLFEVLMKPKVLLWALVSNVVIYGLIQLGQYIYNGPYPLWWIHMQNTPAESTQKDYSALEQGPAIVTSPGNSAIQSVKVVWENKTNEIHFGALVVHGTSVFAGEESGGLSEYDLKDGQRLRRFEIGKPVMASPLILEQNIYVGEGIHTTHSARIYSFDLLSGTFAGSFATHGHIERAAVPTKIQEQSILLVPAGKDGLYAVDAKTMKQVWQAPVGHIDSSPLTDGEFVFVGTGLEQGFEETPTKIFALNVKTGSIVWEKSIPTSTWGVPVLWQEYVCFPMGDVYKNTRYGQLACYHRQSGNFYAAFNTTGALVGKPVITGAHLLIADFYGTIYQYNLKTKELEWTVQVPTKGINYSSVFIDEKDRVILPGAEGLYFYDREDQKELFVWKPSTKWRGAFTNVVQANGLLILSDRTGTLRALKVQ